MLSREGNLSNSLQSSTRLDQNGHVVSPASHSATGSISGRRTLYVFPHFICVPCFYLTSFLSTRSFTSLPSHLSHPRCLPRLHIKAVGWFLTVKQAVFSPALCEETKIISMNMKKREKKPSASMVISSPVISISVKLTWLNLTYIQMDGNTLLQSPLGLESLCTHLL